MEVNHVLWFSNGMGTIGIVLCTNEMGKKKAYIRQCAGHDEEEDIQTILKLGAKLHDSQVEQLTKHFSKNEEQ
jgi:hypothetical protein